MGTGLFRPLVACFENRSGLMRKSGSSGPEHKRLTPYRAAITNESANRDKQPQLHQLRQGSEGHVRDCIHLHGVRDGRVWRCRANRTASAAAPSQEERINK
jgi:hypothetical protein